MTIEIDEEWEEWSPEKGSFVNHMIAGSCAGVVEHVAIFPVDTIKTHMQCQRCPINGTILQLSAFQTGSKLIHEHGFLRLFRGVNTMLTASIPAHALYFSSFEACKRVFGANTQEITPLASGSAGVCATVTHDLIMTPMDVIKQRLQLGLYKGVFDCFKQIVNVEGARALYLSFPTTLLMNLPYSMVMTGSNETFKKILNPSGELNVKAYLLSGAAAGALAGFVTTPLDVVKTRLQTQQVLYNNNKNNSQPRCPKTSSNGVVLNVPQTCGIKANVKKGTISGSQKYSVKYHGLLDTIYQIKLQEGYRGFVRGAVPRVLQQAPSQAIAWTTFEVIKNLLESEG